MDEENMMDDKLPKTDPSESAFSGTSDDARRKPNLPFEVQSRPYLIKATGKLRFDLWKPSLEKSSGVTFENGRMYMVGGTVAGMRFASRHIANGNPQVYVFVEGGARVAPGETCTLLVDTLEERRRFAVLMGKRGPVVRLTRTLLEGLGIPTGESSVVELEVRKPRDEGTRRVYSRWDPLLGFMELQLGGAGFAVGDMMEVVGGRRYDVGAFVEDFRAHRLSELANIELGLEGGRLVALVDGKQVPVEKHWLTTHGLKAALKVELGYDHRVTKFVFDGTTVEARFGNCDPILEWSAAGSGVDVRYSRGAGQAYVMRLEQEPPALIVSSLNWLARGVRVVERPSTPEGMYLLEMSEAVRETARQNLNETRGGTAYARTRGDIGEEIVRLSLQDLGMELVYDHPWSELSPRYGSLRHGPDFMVRCQGSRLVVYVEVKWWEDILQAFERGTERVRYYVHNTPAWKGLKIDGGYIVALDWKLTKTARVWVERVV